MPFLKPLASDLLLQEEQRRQKRRLREQQEAARAEEQRKERLRKKQGSRQFFGRRSEQAGGAGGRPEEWGTALDRDRDSFNSEGGEVEGEGEVEVEGETDSSGDVILARNGRRKNKLQEFGASCMQSIQQKRTRVGDLFKNFTQSLNLPSKDEIIDGCEGPVKKHSGPKRRDMDEEDENELEKKLREAVRREEKEGQGERDVKGPIGLFKNVRKCLYSLLNQLSLHSTHCLSCCAIPCQTILCYERLSLCLFHSLWVDHYSPHPMVHGVVYTVLHCTL